MATEKSTASFVETDVLTESDIWPSMSADVWRARTFYGSPSYYPVYKYLDYYSYSVMNLIRFKGSLTLNHEFIARARRNRMNYYSGIETIDRDVVRIGGVIHPRSTIHDKTDYAERIAEAMKADASAVEDTYPTYRHAAMCGGKDSLNILLLPWKTKLTVLSAAPNYAFVKEFVSRNRLPHNVVELEDKDTSVLQSEILYNACLNNLEHCRWTGELKTFAGSLDRKVIVWKGQLGDSFMTPSWRSYAHSTSRLGQFYKKQVESRVRQRDTEYLKNRFFQALWYRGAMWQGAHMSLLRSVCDTLFLSAYHGKAMTQLLSEVDLSTAVTDDLRPLVGRLLHGSEVKYPNSNPGPPRSHIRTGLSDPEHFLTAFREATNIPICSD